MRTIGVVTGSRADYGIYVPVLRRIQSDRVLALQLLVTGMHLSPRFGMTVDQIEADGFEVVARVPTLTRSDSPSAVAQAMARGTAGFASAFKRSRPDLLIVLGDRFEMHAAAIAALPFNIPIAHLHGGELTEGAIDDALRHSMTKLSHLHFAATEEYARRIVQLGEEPWRVTVSGAPALDHLASVRLLSAAELEARAGIRVTSETLLVTYHPVTLEPGAASRQIEEVLSAVKQSGRLALFTMPNADTGGLAIRRCIERFVRREPGAQFTTNLGSANYFSALALVAAMVGNSSSGLIEAPSVGLPVVNIGSRQRGRVRGANVIDAGNGRAEILEAIERATDPRFKKTLVGMKNPYGDGNAADRIVTKVAQVELTPELMQKRFHDLVTR